MQLASAGPHFLMSFPCGHSNVMQMPKATRLVVVPNPQGVHARPADLFVKLAHRYQSKIEVIKDGECVDGKSILHMLTLDAVKGTELRLEAEGPDADEALSALADLVAKGFGELEESA